MLEGAASVIAITRSLQIIVVFADDRLILVDIRLHLLHDEVPKLEIIDIFCLREI